ncbi:MAG TPA: hypothetical protein VKM55_19440, partial [Candidatus Lokiarchaeia archaeon]|nr:hypothetical protein [Candidatus Lokiarchaeia archaeon]
RLEYMATTYVETSPEHDKKVVIIGGLEHGIVPGKSVPTAYQEQNFPHPLRQDDSTTWPWLENQLYTNNSFIIDGGKLSFQEKQTPVKIDKGNGKYIIEPIEIRPEPQIKIFDTSVGKISIFICKDFLRLAGAIRHWARDNLVNYIVVPSLTSKVLPFTQRLINLYEQPNMDDITIITANVGEYGGSEVYSVKHKDAIERSFHDNKRDNLGEVVVKRRISKNQ